MSKAVIRWLAATLVVSASASLASASEKYHCVAEKSTGFQWNGLSWDIVKPKVDDAPYIVREVEQYPYASGKWTNFEVWRFGAELPQHRCFRNQLNSTYVGFMHCGGSGFGFSMFFDSLRFEEFYGIGHHDSSDEPGEIQEVIMGKCLRTE